LPCRGEREEGQEEESEEVEERGPGCWLMVLEVFEEVLRDKSCGAGDVRLVDCLVDVVDWC
jgi:hypothetical protein